MKIRDLLPFACLLACATPVVRAEDAASPAQGQAAPQVFLDKSPQVIAYQLKRLTNSQLAALHRNTSDKKYAPVYQALLTRKGLEKKYREEAVAALVKVNGSAPTGELLGGIGKLEAGDVGTLGELVAMLMAQTPEALAGQRAKLQELATGSQPDTVRQAAFGALAAADAKPDAVWELAAKDPRSLPLLLRGVTMVPFAEVRAAFYPRIKPLVTQAPDEATQLAAIEALSYAPGHEDEAFKLLSELVTSGEGERRAAAVRSLRRIPADKWPAEQVGPLAQAVVTLVEQTPAEQRLTPAGVEAVQLGNDLAAALPPDKGAPVRKSLRELGVRVVMIRTIKEQMLFDLRYFAVQAGKPVQVLLDNPDAMPHNFVLTLPGALQEVGIAGGSMAPPTDPARKAFVPNNKKVLEATHLVQPGESTTLSFTAPEKPGEYVYVCTFPGHWVRMYGVMVVVDDLDAYDQSPKAPTDPLLRKPFTEQKVDPSKLGAPPAAAHAHPK